MRAAGIIALVVAVGLLRACMVRAQEPGDPGYSNLCLEQDIRLCAPPVVPYDPVLDEIAVPRLPRHLYLPPELREILDRNLETPR